MTENTQIMLIEDNIDDYEAICRAFKQCGFEGNINWFNDSSEAHFSLLESRFQAPTVIILDLNIPGVDGRTLLSMIKADESLKGIPVIVFTTSSDNKDIKYCYEHGVTSYIQKPIGFERLVAICNSIKEYWFSICLLPEAEV